MRVVDIVAHVVRYPEPNDFGAQRMTVLVEARAKDGTCGWGEAIAMWPEACAAVVELVGGLAQLVVGEEADDTQRHWRAMREHSWWYGEGGIAALAIAAIDMALWDLRGKLAGEPLWQMLGNRVHDSLPACASLHVNQEGVDANVRQIAGFINNDGFSVAKLGFGKKGLATVGQDPHYDIAFVREVRAALGPQVPLHIDIGNGVRWSVATALQTMAAMAEIGVGWIEEPLPPTDHAGYRELKAKLGDSVQIAAGEREYTLAGYRHLLATGAVDVFGIDPARVEGITGHARIVALLGEAGKVVNAHAWSTAVSSAAALALSVCSPTAVLFELKPQASPMQHELVDEPLWHVAGQVAPSAKPGLGIEPKRSVIDKYAQ